MSTATAAPDLYNAAAASQYLGVSVSTFNTLLVGQGHIEHCQTARGRYRRFAHADLAALKPRLSEIMPGAVPPGTPRNENRTWLFDFVHQSEAQLKNVRAVLSRSEQARFAEDLIAVREYYENTIPGAYWHNRRAAEKWLRLIETRIATGQDE